MHRSVRLRVFSALVACSALRLVASASKRFVSFSAPLTQLVPGVMIVDLEKKCLGWFNWTGKEYRMKDYARPFGVRLLIKLTEYVYGVQYSKWNTADKFALMSTLNLRYSMYLFIRCEKALGTWSSHKPTEEDLEKSEFWNDSVCHPFSTYRSQCYWSIDPLTRVFCVFQDRKAGVNAVHLDG